MRARQPGGRAQAIFPDVAVKKYTVLPETPRVLTAIYPLCVFYEYIYIDHKKRICVTQRFFIHSTLTMIHRLETRVYTSTTTGSSSDHQSYSLKSV